MWEGCREKRGNTKGIKEKGPGEQKEALQRDRDKERAEQNEEAENQVRTREDLCGYTCRARRPRGDEEWIEWPKSGAEGNVEQRKTQARGRGQTGTWTKRRQEVREIARGKPERDHRKEKN